LHGPVRVPANVGTGATLVKLSFDAWDKGQVHPSEQEVRTVAPRSGPPPQPVSPRLTKRLVHPDHNERVGTTFFSPDSRWILASAPYTGGLQIWDAHTGAQIRTQRLPEGSGGTSTSPILSPDGRTFYVPVYKYKTSPTRKEGKIAYRNEVDGEITVWDVASGRQLPSLKQSPPHGVVSVRPSPMAPLRPQTPRGSQPVRSATAADLPV
jgi:WD40 repeat protein